LLKTSFDTFANPRFFGGKAAGLMFSLLNSFSAGRFAAEVPEWVAEGMLQDFNVERLVRLGRNCSPRHRHAY